MSTSSKPATTHTAAANRAVFDNLHFEDRRAYDDSRRGFVATLDPMVITDDTGRVVWDLERFAFLDDDAPDTVNPSLWRISQLHNAHGLFRVADHIYQLRGFDISNMTVIEGDTGYVVIDPLTSVECARAAMDLVYENLGHRPIRAILYTHSHADHFGGVKGIVSEDDVTSGAVRVVAPLGFLEHAVSENVYAGNAMIRRAEYMYGQNLPVNGTGVISTGLGIALSQGQMSLLQPTDVISASGQELVLDGIRFEFQYTPDSEAPAEMHFYLPDMRALCMAENVSHHMHNLYTPRGAQVRDALGWSRYLDEALQRYGSVTDVMFICHQWPVWGSEAICDLLAEHRDLYRYIHDETLRLAAHGYTMTEIGEMIELPEGLATSWTARGYYGSLNHNAKGVYQKYLGWFDGNPAHLHPHTPVETGRRYVEFMGGADSVIEKARTAFDEGDYRWVAEVVNHVVFAEPDNTAARELQADALEQLGYQSESAPWRNFYLTGAQDLREGVHADANALGANEVVAAMTVDMLLDYLAVRLNGPKAGGRHFTLRLDISDAAESRMLELTRGVLNGTPTEPGADADATAQLTKATLTGLALGAVQLADAVAAGKVELGGDESVVYDLFALLDTFTRSFNIVTP
ncbi:MBL fold metallo-hydrolase [Gordonia sp. SID5947]|uniref:alkyl/aryl-sulfatase n=1 Tax=Gordonia sp. SID5947 TaxID=2690315 RepID=UPI00136F9FC0|nr:alkyl sulfatase dimerization domain-containing protein [Gordonia sp. SID5947]MYR07739.1 MBL fold metallo-hydrolase [Gordonia sp. SID5947]